jgi:hypothetical protein
MCVLRRPKSNMERSSCIESYQGIGYKQLDENKVLYTLDTCHMSKTLVASYLESLYVANNHWRRDALARALPGKGTQPQASRNGPR